MPVSPQPLSSTTPASVNSPQYRTANFMMYGFKVALCSRPGRHQWDECPFAHPTENARRRDPRIFSYSCHECPSYRNTGFCAKGDSCEYSHGIFEARLHPDSFRTVQCKDGSKCRRKICFFYHSEDERRTPTGLHEARAQITAELGDSAFDLTGEQLRAAATTLLTSSPCVSSTIQEINTSLSQPICHSQTMRTVRNHGPAASPLASARSAGAALSTAFSNLSVSAGNSGVLLGQDTVAPCMKGANRNKARLRELAHEVGIHPDVLMNALRVSALQGELTPQSIAPALPHGTFTVPVEAILQELAESEDLPLDKLRGWLQRQLSPRCASPGSPVRQLSPMRQHSTPRQLSPFTPSNSTSPDMMLPPAMCYGGHATPSPRRVQSARHGSRSPHSSGPFLPHCHDDAIRAVGGSGQLDNRKPARNVSWKSDSRRSASDAMSWRPRSGRADPRSQSDSRW